MKKKLLSELHSLAKRILDSDDALDTASMRSLAAQLHERLLILNYLEQQPEADVSKTGSQTTGASLDSKSYREQNWFNDPKPVPQPTYSEEIAEPLIEKIKDIVAQIPQETEKVDDLLNEMLSKKGNIQSELEELASHYQEIPVFERKEVPKENSKGLYMNQDDRRDFLIHLFDNDQEDFSRVISQINSMSSFDEAEAFISGQIKPEYDNWKDKDNYEHRFVSLIEKHFS
jgi:hypothetical protein